ncbi:hypothetical protein Tco_1299198, partial [Tanacetum coccineum]
MTLLHARRYSSLPLVTCKIIMVNVIPPDHDHDVPVVEPNQHDDAFVVPEPILENKDEDPEEDEFKEEEDPQEEDDMEIDIEEDENEPELTYPYEEVNPLNPPPPASEHEDETVPVSVYKVGESSTAAIPREDGDRLLPGFMRQDIDSLFGRMLILDLGNEVRSSVEQGTAAMEKLVEKLSNVEEKAECKKLKKELEEARLSNTFLRMQNERVKRDLYWTRVQAHEFFQEMIRRGFMFEETPNEAIDISIEDEKSPLSEPQGSPPDVYVDADIAAERAMQANVRNDASGSGPVRGRDTAPAVRECNFAGFMKCNHAAVRGVERAVELRRWFEKTESVFEISERRFNELALMCPRMVEPERVKVDAYIRVLTDNIKGEVTSSKPVDLNEAVRMAYKLMGQKSQARNERILEGKKRKWENLQGGNSGGKGNQKDNSLQTLQNNLKQGNARAMVTAPTNGKLPLCERCFTRHVGQCMIKCHKCGKVILRCPKKVKQEEVGEVRGRAYAIKDAKPKGPNVVT